MLLALGIVEAVHDDADGEAEEFVDLPHPLGVALGEIVVDGHDKDAAAGKRVQVDGKRGDQRLAFAGLHLGNLAFVQHHAANELDVEVALAERALAGLAYRGEGRNQNVVEGGAFGELLLELLRPRAQRLVGERLEVFFQRVDRFDAREVGADAPVIGGTEQLTSDCADHRDFILPKGDCATRSTSSLLARVQGAENAGLFGLLQGDVGKVFGAPGILAER